MLCESPLKILNPSKVYVPGKDKAWLEVPCGKCASCRKSLQDDWFIRIYTELKHTEDIGGFSIFFTLTYDNEHLPYFTSDKDKGYKIPAFNYNHLKTFFNSFRKAYERENITGIKYFIASEYGEHTLRPHYHGLMHFPTTLDIHTLVNRLRKYWKYGFVGIGESDSSCIIRDVINSAKYVSKYITKDLTFYNRRDLNAFLYHSKDYVEQAKRKKEIKPYLPMHRQSQGYGSHLIDIIQSSSNPIDYFITGYALPLETYHYQLPKYISNKMCYTTDANGTRILTEFGKDVKEALYKVHHKKTTDLLTKELTFIGLKSLGITDEDTKEWFGINTVADLHHHLLTLLGTRTTSDLAAYKMVYHNVSRRSSYFNSSRFTKYTLQQLVKIAPIIFVDRVRYDISDITPNTGKIWYYDDHIKSNVPYTFNHHPEFEGFADILSYLSTIKARVVRRKNIPIKKKDLAVNRLKQFFKEAV